MCIPEESEWEGGPETYYGLNSPVKSMLKFNCHGNNSKNQDVLRVMSHWSSTLRMGKSSAFSIVVDVVQSLESVSILDTNSVLLLVT